MEKRHFYFSAGESIGDTLVATPVVKSIKELYPDCEITWYVFPRTAGLLDYIPEIDHIIITTDISPNTIKVPLVVLHGLYLNNYNYASSVASVGHLLDCCYLIAERHIGQSLKRYRQPYLIVPEDIPGIPDWLLELSKNPYITIQSQVGDGNNSRRNVEITKIWTATKVFNELYKIPIVQIGGENHPLISDNAGYSVYDLRGVPPIIGAWAIKHSKLFVGPTSGPCLEADAFNIPVVLFKSPSDPPEYFGPVISKTVVLPEPSVIQSKDILAGMIYFVKDFEL